MGSHKLKFDRSDSIDIPIERIRLSLGSTSNGRTHLDAPSKNSLQDGLDRSEFGKSNSKRKSWTSSLLKLKPYSFLAEDDLLQWLDELSDESDEECPWHNEFKNRSLTYNSHSYEIDTHKPLQESIDLKGFNSENIKVKMSDQLIEVSAEKESQSNGVRRSNKTFQEILIPESVDKEKLKCYLTADCMLILEAPCKENLKRRDSVESLDKEITIKSNRSSARSPVLRVPHSNNDSQSKHRSKSPRPASAHHS